MVTITIGRWFADAHRHELDGILHESGDRFICCDSKTGHETGQLAFRTSPTEMLRACLFVTYIPDIYFAPKRSLETQSPAACR